MPGTIAEPTNSTVTPLAAITGVERYNPSNTEALVAFVNAQCSEGHYDLNVNLAVLKLYQFNPSHTDIEVISKILVKALTQLPNPDFNLCLYLLNEQVLDNEDIKKILQAHELLETAKYREFWQIVSSLSALTSQIKGFAESIRAFIILTVGITFQKISVAVLASYLHLEGEALTGLIQSAGWHINNDIVSVALNEDNQAKPAVIQESIKFEQLTKIIGYSNAI